MIIEIVGCPTQIYLYSMLNYIVAYHYIFFNIYYSFQLHTERDAVQDAPAVYFVRPTVENVKRIAEDCAKQVCCGIKFEDLQ